MTKLTHHGARRHNASIRLAKAAVVVAASLAGSFALAPTAWAGNPVLTGSELLPAGTVAAANTSAVSCVAPGSCIAVGTYQAGPGKPYAAFIATETTSKWGQPVTPPEPAGKYPGGPNQPDSLNAVSCAGTSCVAVGDYIATDGGGFGLIETFSIGGSATAFTAPLPTGDAIGASQYATLTSVDCSSSDYCMAVGRFEDTTIHMHGLIETDQFGSWTTATANEPNAPGGPIAGTGSEQYANLDAVACVTYGWCEAVGLFKDTDGYYHGLIDATYDSVTVPGTAADGPSTGSHIAGNDADGYQSAGLNSVSCTVEEMCVAVGEYGDTSGFQYALIDTLSGATWTSSTGPEPCGCDGTDADGMRYAALFSVACPAANQCVTVGTWRDDLGYITTMIDSLAGAGATWTSVVAPVPANAGTTSDGDAASFLQSVASAGVGQCEAAGSFEDDNGSTYGLVDTINGAGWTNTSATMPNPAPTDSGNNMQSLDAVSCSTQNCTAVGWYVDYTDYLAGGTGSNALADDSSTFA